jgi:hypothetical protein
MDESTFEPANPAQPSRKQPVSVLELYQEALRKRGFEADNSQYFTLLVDVFYDQRVKMIVSAATQPGELLARDVDGHDPQLQALVFQFDRTTSRLAEMQTREYLEQPRGGRGE